MRDFEINIYAEVPTGLPEKQYQGISYLLTRHFEFTNKEHNDFEGVYYRKYLLFATLGERSYKEWIQVMEDINLWRRTNDRARNNFQYLTFICPKKLTKIGSMEITNKSLRKSLSGLYSKRTKEAQKETILTDVKARLHEVLVRKNYTEDELIIRLNPTIPIHAKFIQMIDIDLEGVDIDELIGKMYQRYLQKRQDDRDNGEKIKSDEMSYLEYKEDKLNDIKKIKDLKYNSIGNIIEDKIQVSQNMGRVSTPFTTLNKLFRPYLTINGNKLKEPDLSATHPAIFALKILPMFPGYENCDFTAFYKEHTQKGTYYEAWAELLKNDIELSPKQDPLRHAKRFSLAALNSRAGYKEKRGELSHELFCEYFPEAGEVMTAIKTCKELKNKRMWLPGKNINEKTGKLKKRPNIHSNMNFILCTEEVRIFTSLWHQLHQNNIPFVAIYDSILVEDQNINITLEIMNRIMEQEFGQFFKINIKL